MEHKWIFISLVVISFVFLANGAKKLGDDCSNDSECGDDAMICSGYVTSQCKCAPTTKQEKNKCIKPGLDKNCETDVGCKDCLQCEDSKCVYINMKWNPTIKECENFTNYVQEVTQNYWVEINDLIVSQITKELQASYIYQAYASYFQRSDVALPGVRKFFADASLEEREHAQMLIDYINSRGGHVQFDNITLTKGCQAVASNQEANEVKSADNKRMCICNFVSKRKDTPECGDRANWKNALVAFEDALATERFVNRELLNIHEKADKAKDAHLTHVLEHQFLEEQVTSINQLGHYVTRLRSFKGNTYHLGEYLFDQNLK